MEHPLSEVSSVVQLLELPYFDLLGCIHSDSLHPGGGVATQCLLDLLRISRSDRILEIGCGPGWTTRALVEAGMHVTAVEKSDTMLRAFKYHFDSRALDLPRVYLGSVEELGHMPDGPFDIVLMECVFGFIQDKGKALAQIRAHLAPGGRIGVLDLHYVTLPTMELQRRLEAEIGCQIEPMTFGDWRDLFSDFKQVEWETFELPHSGKRTRNSLFSRSLLDRECPWFTDSDADKLAARLYRSDLVFLENKSQMRGHLAVWRK